MAIDARVKLFSGRDADAPVVFVGEPGSVSGTIWLENAEAGELELRRASVHSPNVRPTELTRTDRIAHIPVPKYLRGHQRQRVSISFDLDRATPPGTYDATVVVEGAEGTAAFPAQIVVTQRYALSIRPNQLVVTAAPGGTFTGEVVVVNKGNVPIEVTPLGEFPLEDPSREPPWWCCCCEDGRAADAEREDEGEPEFGVIALDNDRTTVEPGALAPIRFAGRLPGGLPANMHLRARPRIGIERFSLDVITPPAGASEPRSESGRRRPSQKRKRS